MENFLCFELNYLFALIKPFQSIVFRICLVPLPVPPTQKQAKTGKC